MQLLKAVVLTGAITSLVGCVVEPTDALIDFNSLTADTNDLNQQPVNILGQYYSFPAFDFLGSIVSPDFSLAADSSWELSFSYELTAPLVPTTDGEFYIGFANAEGLLVAYHGLGTGLLNQDPSTLSAFVINGENLAGYGISMPDVGDLRYVWISYADDTDLYEVYISGTEEKPVEPSISYTVDLGEFLDLETDVLADGALERSRARLMIGYVNIDFTTEMRLNNDFSFNVSPSVLFPE